MELQGRDQDRFPARDLGNAPDIDLFDDPKVAELAAQFVVGPGIGTDHINWQCHDLCSHTWVWGRISNDGFLRTGRRSYRARMPFGKHLHQQRRPSRRFGLGYTQGAIPIVPPEYRYAIG